MAAAAVARSVLRSPALHSGASRVVAVTTAASRPPFRRVPSLRPAIPGRFFRSPVEASFCLESLMPMHSATASALMTSMLGVSRRRCGWLSEGQDETR